MQIRSLWNPLVYIVVMLNVLQVYFTVLGFHMFIEKDCCILTLRETTIYEVAHSLVKNALCIADFQVWMEDVPSHIGSILQLDVVEFY